MEYTFNDRSLDQQLLDLANMVGSVNLDQQMGNHGLRAELYDPNYVPMMHRPSNSQAENHARENSPMEIYAQDSVGVQVRELEDGDEDEDLCIAQHHRDSLNLYNIPRTFMPPTQDPHPSPETEPLSPTTIPPTYLQTLQEESQIRRAQRIFTTSEIHKISRSNSLTFPDVQRREQAFLEKEYKERGGKTCICGFGVWERDVSCEWPFHDPVVREEGVWWDGEVMGKRGSEGSGGGEGKGRKRSRESEGPDESPKGGKRARGLSL